MSEALYRSLVEANPDALIFSDTEGTIRVWNRAAEALFGYTAEEAVGRSLDLVIPERLRAAHWDGFRRAFETGVAKTAGRVLTTRSMTKDGRTIYVAIAFALVNDEVGACIGALATSRDCTEAYLAQRAAKAASAG